MNKQRMILIGIGVVAGYFLAEKLVLLNIPGGFNPFTVAGQKGSELGM